MIQKPSEVKKPRGNNLFLGLKFMKERQLCGMVTNACDLMSWFFLAYLCSFPFSGVLGVPVLIRVLKGEIKVTFLGFMACNRREGF